MADDPFDADAIARDQEELHLAALADSEAKKLKARAKAQADVVAETESQRKIVGRRASDFEVRRTRWLWRDRVPLGGLSLLAGKGDVSKSTVFAQFAAWLTTGNMKGEFYGRAMNVGYVVNEDSVEETVIPRMIAHGADLERVLFLDTQSPAGTAALKLPRDEQQLIDFIKDSDLAVVFLDPLSANVSGNKNDQGDMRDTFQIVNNVAMATGCSIFGLAHSRKAGGEDVVEAVIGSSEQTNVARSVHGLVADPEEDGARVLSAAKLNVGQKHLLASLRFRVHSVDIPCADGTVTSAPQIEWLEEIDESVNDILADRALGIGNVDECALWLANFVYAEGSQVQYADILEAAKAKRFSEGMLQRARKKTKIKSRRMKTSPPRSVWFIPGADAESED